MRRESLGGRIGRGEWSGESWERILGEKWGVVGGWLQGWRGVRVERCKCRGDGREVGESRGSIM